MLNNKGWGLQALMLCIIILMFALVIAYSIADKTFGLSDTQYHRKEAQVVEAIKKYKKKNKIVVEQDEEKVITIKTLKETNILKNINCTGYGIYSKKEKDTYKAYIKCDNYTTDGYLEYLDESL